MGIMGKAGTQPSLLISGFFVSLHSHLDGKEAGGVPIYSLS